ncbi:TVP38/TMEM64 family protein [Paenibacillus sp. LPE1-1-1.1]|uniref:TVP38/TMEM64 family protein n=1 Tax=Paenibacillus sp. LPE1-1-1.1 TaxID=3135230 RepID=UPI0034221E4B
MIKWIIASLNIAVMLAVFLNMDVLIDWIEQKENSGFIVVFVLTVVLAAVPGIPFGLVGGLIGAKYGLLWGSMMNVAASTLAAALVYLLFRYLLNSLGTALAEKNASFRRMHEFIKHHTFWALLIARIIPVMPAALINLYAGVFGLPFKIFILSTLLGKIPVMLVFAYVGANMRSGSTNWMAAVAIYCLFLLMVYAGYQWRYKRI